MAFLSRALGLSGPRYCFVLTHRREIYVKRKAELANESRLAASNPLDAVPDEIPKIFEDGIQLMRLNYLLAFDGVIASRDGIPLIDEGTIIGAIGCSGGTDSQDEIVSKVGAAVINQLQATNK